MAMDTEEDGDQRGQKRAAEMDDVCLIDATKEGNVSRFINVSPSQRGRGQRKGRGHSLPSNVPPTAQLPAQPVHPERLHGLP